MKTETNRNSAFELLRIVAMFMIVWGHCMLATAQNQEPYLGTLDNIGWFVGAFTVCAVNLFFLLTGYFAQSRNYKWNRIVYIWFKTILYSIGICLIVSLLTGNFEWKMMLSFCFPVFLRKYWYMQVYIVLAFLTPYIAYTLEHLDKKKHTILVVVLLLFFCVHETFIKVSMTLDQTQGYGIIWACTLFVVGNWLRCYGDKYICRISAGWWNLAYIIMSILIFLSNYLIVRYDIASGVNSRGNFYAYNSLTVFLQSVFLFCAFIQLAGKWKGYTKKWINRIGKNTLAVYLISAHPLLLYPLWTDILPEKRIVDFPIIYILVSIVASAGIIGICVLIDKIVNMVLKTVDYNFFKYFTKQNYKS